MERTSLTVHFLAPFLYYWLMHGQIIRAHLASEKGEECEPEIHFAEIDTMKGMIINLN